MEVHRLILYIRNPFSPEFSPLICPLIDVDEISPSFSLKEEIFKK